MSYTHHSQYDFTLEYCSIAAKKRDANHYQADHDERDPKNLEEFFNVDDFAEFLKSGKCIDYIFQQFLVGKCDASKHKRDESGELKNKHATPTVKSH